MTIDVESLHNRRADNRWDRMSVGDVLERMSHSDPDKVAFIAAPQALADPRYARLTYGDAERTANGAANALLGLGLQRADRVAMLCDNSVEAYVTKLAIAKAGLVAAPINTMMAPDVVTAMLRHVDARNAIVDGDLWHSGGRAFEAAGVRPVATIRAGGAEVVPGTMDFFDFVASGAATEPDVRIHGDDIWEILLTSGTTALPKAVMISHTYSYMAALGHALSYTRGLRFETDFRTCTFLPVIYHVGDHASVLSSLLCGGSVVFGRKPTGVATASAVTRERVTCLWAGSPQFLADLVRDVDADPMAYDLRSLTTIVYGWSTPAPGLVAALERLCGDVGLVGLFGQTEAIACHRFWPDRWPETFRRTAPEVNYVGLPISLLGSVVVDADGRSLRDRPGVPGEAVYRSPAMTSGYFRNQEATEAAFRDGWFHSGDSCMYDSDGLRIMVDRYKDIIKSGGENVSTIRVETVVVQHPSVASAAVIGVPHERWGEAVTAVVTATAGATVDERAVIAFCRERLAGFETPKRVVVLDELPVTVGGKVLKYRLREMLTGVTAPPSAAGSR
ncbi:MAG: AMP-binding protein [Solirubrobacteraceae bacterium]